MKIINIIILCLFSVSCFAEPTVLLEKGDVAPFRGFLIDVDKAQKLRTISLDLDLTRKENEVLAKRLELQEGHIEKLSNRQSFLDKIGYFLLGVGVTTLTVFGVSRALR